MGRAVVTKGHSRRRLGRTIRNLENSVELSPKESFAKMDEQKYKAKMQHQSASDDSPVQSLRYPIDPKKARKKS